LYDAAVDVLIRTWNVEGFKPLDNDETLAQLSYVACAMMLAGQQQVGRRRLLELLQQARDELQAELHLTEFNPSAFISRIEYRSSLLMQTGHEVIDGELQEAFEFRHLTFQEYLTARGFVKEQYPGREAGASLLELLEPHFADERWREVIPLAAVMAGHKVEPLIRRLTGNCEKRPRDQTSISSSDVASTHVVLLRQCLLDEVQLNPAVLRAALRQLVRHGAESLVKGSIGDLRRGKFGDLLEQVAEHAFLGSGSDWLEYQFAFRDLAMESIFRQQPIQLTGEIAAVLDGMMRTDDRIQQARAAIVCGRIAYLHGESARKTRHSIARRFHLLRDTAGHLLESCDKQVAFAAITAISWMGAMRLPSAPPEKGILLSILRIWRESEFPMLCRYAAWAFAAQPLLPRETLSLEDWGDCKQWINQTIQDNSGVEGLGEEVMNALLVLAWYRHDPWTDEQLITSLSNGSDSRVFRATARDLLATLRSAI
jgi:hypothetical protein